MEKARLDKIIAGEGTYSRREVRLLVRQGRVLVDGKDVRTLTQHSPPRRTAGGPQCWTCCRRSSGGGDCFRWVGWTRIRRDCCC